MSELDAVRETLVHHFRRVEFGPPASPAVLARLRGALPAGCDDLIAFYAECNGIDAGLEDTVEGQILPAEQMLDWYPVVLAEDLATYPVLARLWPVRQDGCGDYDCYLAPPGAGIGAIVFWDHEVYESPAYLLGGTLGSYLRMWADSLVFAYRPDGTVRPECDVSLHQVPGMPPKPPEEHPWPFDEAWMAAHDPRAASLLQDPLFRNLVVEQDEE